MPPSWEGRPHKYEGTRVAVVRDGSGRLESVGVAGGAAAVTLLKPVSDYVTHDPNAAVTWSPDGTALALASGDWALTDGSRLFIVNADGSGVSAVPGVPRAADPAWRPQ